MMELVIGCLKEFLNLSQNPFLFLGTDHLMKVSFLRHGNVIPIFKIGDKSLPSNYRPVALLSCLGKLQEKIVFKNLYNFFN